MLGKALKDLRNGLLLYHVWVYQAYHEITAKYKRTILGSLWISGSMVATSLSLSIIFGGIFGQSLQVALPFIMGGMLAFTLAAFPLNESPEIFMSSSSIIRNHAYPFTYYILEATAKSVFLFLHNLVVYFIAMACVGAFKLPHWSLLLALPVAILFMLSWGTLTAMVASRFRDMRFLLPYIGQLLSVLTPIFWNPSNLQGWRSHLVNFNPFYGIVEIIRSALHGKMAEPHVWLLALVATGAGVLLWIVFFPLGRRRIPFWI